MSPARKPAPRNSAVAIDIAVEAGDWPPARALKKLVARAIAAAAAGAGVKLSPAAEVSLLFTDDGHIRALNCCYRGNGRPTNVLSFPASAPGEGFGPLLGDIVLARETIEREAVAEGLTVDDHLTHLIVHGFLHLLGHDHEEDRAATVMENLETAILAELGIADPYAEPRAGR